MPAGFDAAFAKVKQLVADFRANEKFKDFYINRCDSFDRGSSPAGAGEGGRRPSEGCWEKTNFCALVYDLYALTPAEIQIVEGADK